MYTLWRARAVRREGGASGHERVLARSCFTGQELLRSVASLVPPPRANLTRFHGVFAPGARLRPFLVPQAGEQEASVGHEAAAGKERVKERTPRVDLRRVAQEDVRLRRVRLREVWRKAAGVGVGEGGPRGAGDCGAPGLAHGLCEVGPGTRGGFNGSSQHSTLRSCDGEQQESTG
ncbi:transposase [Myxococcus xanthus]|nr:transposase [Myxococcus xanthus]